ncbi:MAG: nuclear transport factor 2 family protein [Gemmatimonadaceae bacterium]
MNSRLLLLLALLTACAAQAAITSESDPRPAPPPSDSLNATLTTLERQSWVAWQNHDGGFFRAFLSDDHVEVGTTGIATKAQVVAYVSSGACIVNSYTVGHFRATRIDDNTALLTYRAEQQTTCGNAAVPSPTWVSSLFVHRDGRWLNVLYQHTQEQR